MGGQRALPAASTDPSATLYTDAQVQAGGKHLPGGSSSSSTTGREAQHGSAYSVGVRFAVADADGGEAAGTHDPVSQSGGASSSAALPLDAVRQRTAGQLAHGQHLRDQEEGQQDDEPGVVPMWRNRQQQHHQQQDRQQQPDVTGASTSNQQPHQKPHVHHHQQQQQHSRQEQQQLRPLGPISGGAAAGPSGSHHTRQQQQQQQQQQQPRAQAERSYSGGSMQRSGSQLMQLPPPPVPSQQQRQQQAQQQQAQQQQAQQQQLLQQQQQQQQQQHALYQAAPMYAMPPAMWPGMGPAAYGGVRMVMSPYGPVPIMPHMGSMGMPAHMGHMGMMWQQPPPQQLMAAAPYRPDLVGAVAAGGAVRHGQQGGARGPRHGGGQGAQGGQNLQGGHSAAAAQAAAVQVAAVQAAAAQAAVAQQLAHQGYYYPFAPGPWGVPGGGADAPLGSFYAVPQQVMPPALPGPQQQQHGRGGHGSASSSGSSRHGSGGSGGGRHIMIPGSRHGSSPAPPATPTGAVVQTNVPPHSPTALPEGIENSGWAWLVDGILQQVSAHLSGHSAMRSFRLACRHWRAVADSNVESLSPSSLRPKELVVLFPRLMVLRLIHCPNVRNRDLYVLAQSCIALRSLTIGDDSNKPWVTNRGLCSIGRMRSLTDLSLHDCNSITNNGLTSLQGLSALTRLSLRGCKKITNNGLEVLQNNNTLTSLNLHGCKRISDKGLAALTALPLSSLWLGMTRVKDEGMAYLAQLTGLTELHCTNEEVTDEGIRHLSCLTGLRTLALRDCCEVSGDALQALLPSLPNLTHLNLHKSWEFADEQLLKCIVHMLGLHTLDLRGTWVTDKGLGELTQLSNLRQLALAPHAELYSDALAVVSTLTQLSGLVFSGSARFYTPAVTEALCTLTGLKDLDLSCEAFNDEPTHPDPLPDHVLTSLVTLPHLTTLNLSRRPLAPAQLHKLLAHLPKLAELRLDGCPLDKEHLAALERAFPAVDVHMRVLAPEAGSDSVGEEEEEEAVLGGLGALAL